MNKTIVGVGVALTMRFNKDPKEHTSQIILKAIYSDKAWVYYIDTGKDEIIDFADVAFAHPRETEPPKFSFVTYLYEENKWLLWKPEDGFFVECADPTDFEIQNDKEQNSSSSSTLH